MSYRDKIKKKKTEYIFNKSIIVNKAFIRAIIDDYNNSFTNTFIGATSSEFNNEFNNNNLYNELNNLQDNDYLDNLDKDFLNYSKNYLLILINFLFTELK
ncbi:hypothetical protein ABK040_009965 [Willaertia magna]